MGGFIIVYNPFDKDSFTAAQELITDLQEKMKKPESENEEEQPEPSDEDPPELPSHPFVVVATQGDLKNRDKKNAKNYIDPEAGAEMAGSAGAKFFQVNANGKNV